MSAMSVPLSAARSSRCYQSALLRASRETCQPKTIPTCPRATSPVRVANASRPAVLVPDWPRSPSRTLTRAGCQPSASARSTSARWLIWLSWWSRTCLGLDWRTYTTARRCRCMAVSLPIPNAPRLRSAASGVMAGLLVALCLTRLPTRWGREQTLLTHHDQPAEHLLLLGWGQRLPYLVWADPSRPVGCGLRWGWPHLLPTHDSPLLSRQRPP